MQRRDSLMASRLGKDEGRLSRWQRDKSHWGPGEDCAQDEEKAKCSLIHLDLVPPLDKFSAGKGRQRGIVFFFLGKRTCAFFVLGTEMFSNVASHCR